MIIRIVCALVALAVLEQNAYAAPPSCWPTPANAVAGALPAGVSGRATHYAMWRCDDGSTPWVMGSLAEAMQWLLPVATGTLDTQHAASAWATGAVNVPSAKELAFVHAVAVDNFGVAPWSLDGIAYKQRQGIDTLSFVAVGTLPVGTPCTKAGPAGGYMPVPRAVVKMASKVDTLPLVLYARCG